MSAPRPYGTDPFHPLGSISNTMQFLYIYQSVQAISSMWYVIGSLGMVAILRIVHALFQKVSAQV